MKNAGEIQPLKKKMSILLAAFAALFIVCFFSIGMGSVEATPSEILAVLTGRIVDSTKVGIILNIRLPRIITGVIVGMNLSVAGVLLQGILRNPMASPNIIGVNAGAGLAAILIMTFFPGKIALITPFSFLGALFSAMLIFVLSVGTANQYGKTVQIVLAGMAVTALFNAITNGVMMLNSDVLDVIFSWTLGSLSGRSWSAVEMILPYCLLGLGAALFLSPRLNLFELGDELAGSVGLQTGFYRMVFVILAALLAGSAVAAAGTIGFIGLIAPHIARLMIGSDHRFLLPLSALLGGVLLVISDTLARTVFQPVELSVGIVTATLGAPFFLYLMKRNKKNS